MPQINLSNVDAALVQMQPLPMRTTFCLYA